MVEGDHSLGLACRSCGLPCRRVDGTEDPRSASRVSWQVALNLSCQL